MDDRATALATKLEGVTEASIDWLSGVLAVPLDTGNGPLIRAQVSAAAVALNAQLRADAMRLRAMRDDKALSALLAMIATKERIVPPCLESDAVPGRNEVPVIAARDR